MDILTSIASKVAELLVEPAGRQLGYSIFCEAKIKALEKEKKTLEDKRAAIQLSMDETTGVISPEVKGWVSEVDEIMNELGKFLEEDVKVNKMCFNGWCPNLKLRHSLGRKAKKHTEDVLTLQRKGKFDRISFRPPTEMHLGQSMKAFDSRTKILKQVMEALRDDNIHIIAICGMGGIGKTTMAKEVARRAKEEKLFGVFVMAVVAQNPNVMKIQEEIADTLGFKFDKTTELGRAAELRSKIQKIEKILIILDDIWARLDLEVVGIPSRSEHPRCKIMLTSRNKEVARTQMRSQRTFIIEVLPENEAWNLFEDAAGTSVNNPDLHPIAKQIANECKGLPVAIITVGRALENRGKEEWKDALLQLRKSTAQKISSEMDSNVYSSIELSFNFLRSEEAKFCFLLCCLFPEDHDIPVETLVAYGKGLRLFQNTDTVEEARNRVHTLVQTLKRCFLLLESHKRGCVKLHDVVRDVAISISSKKEHGFVVICNDEIEEWPENDSWENCTTISLVTHKIKKRLDSLVCPKLKLLHLSTDLLDPQEFNENFFRGMEKLEVLAFRKIDIQSLPSSWQNMRTLHLEDCVLKDISSIGALVKLEILRLVGSQIQELPREIGHLHHLKLLDITKCYQLKRIPPAVFSSLTRLEELYMKQSFSEWSPLQGNEEKICASLDELFSLSDHLKVLHIGISEVRLLGKNSVLFNNLTRFWISAIKTTYVRKYRLDSYPFFDPSLEMPIEYPNPLFENVLEIESTSANAVIESGIHTLLNKCEALLLSRIGSLKNVTQLNEDGFSRLKVLWIFSCEDLEYVINLTSKRTHQAAPFGILEEVWLRGLGNLKGFFYSDDIDAKLFPFNRINWLSCLRKLRVVFCHKLRVVFDFDGLVVALLPEKEKTNTTLVTAQLIQEEGHLHGIDHQFRCLGCLPVPSPVRKHKPDQGNNTIQNKSQDRIITATKSSHSDAQGEVRSAARDHPVVLHNMEIVRVLRCDSVGVIFDFGEGQGPFPPVLDNLNRLILWDLPELMHIWNITKKGLHQLVVTSSFQNLRVIGVIGCGILGCIFSPSIAKHLVMLETIGVEQCKSMQAVISDAKEGEEEEKQEESVITTILFPHLRSIKLTGMVNLSCFCDQPIYAFRFPSLESVNIEDCPKLETFVTSATTSAGDMTPMLKRVVCDYKEIFDHNGLGDLNTTIRHNFQLKQKNLRQQEKPKTAQKIEV